MRPGPTRQQGFILLPVVLAITLIAVIAFMLNEEGAGGGHRVSGTLEADQLQHLTEAGMAHALWQTGQAGCGPFSDLPSQPFADGSYAATVTPNNAGGQITSYPVAVSDDAMIKKNSSTQNYGNVAQLETYADLFQTDVRRALYRFDIASAGIPAGASVASAVVRLFVIDANAIADVSVHRITADWSEATVNWDNINTSHDASAVANVYPGTPAGQYIDINITPLVQGWINGGIANQGIMLKTTTVFSDLAQFSSKEYGNAAQLPQLIVNVIDGSLSNRADISATGTLANGASRALQRDEVVLYQAPPRNLTLQPGAAAGKDGWITSTQPDWNYGAHPQLSTNNGGQRSLIDFDLSGLPDRAKVVSASLELYNESNSSAAVTVHRLTTPWIEGSCSGPGCTVDGVTFNTTDSGTPWSMAGGDFEAAPSASGNTAPNDWNSWDVTDLVAGWLSGRYPDYGLLLTSSSGSANFTSSDSPTTSQHPKLSITYTCECGVVCQAPAGSGKLLLVVGDATTVDPDDLKKQALFESWGYTVSLIDDSDDQTAIDAALANNDAAYISQTVSSWVLSNKLNAATIGVLNEEGDLSDNLGTSSNHANSTGRNLTILDNSHDITALFPLGSLPIYSADMDGLSAAGTLAPGLQALGDWGGSPGLAVVETGGILADGSSSAPGRRVTLPLGRDSTANFNWDYLNNNGRLLVQRAIQWAMDNTVVTPVANLLLVVVNPASLTTQEAAKKALIESWGYAVNLIDEADSQASYDTALAANDVVFITEDVNAGTVGTKLVNATIGVVTEEANLSDEFGFSDSINWGSGTDLKVTNTHYITQPFTEGILTVMNTSESLAGLSGALAPDLQPFAASAAGIGPAALESGASTINGRTAAGRRVILPWGGNNFDLNHLNTDGRTIMQRSIEWASTPAPATAPIAHWKLDDGTGTTAIDSAGGHDGTLTNGPTWTGGKLNGALNFDGSNDYIGVPYDASLSLTQSMTFSAWVNASSFGSSYQTILAKDTGAGAGSNYWFGTWQRELVFGFFAGSTFREVFTSGLNLNPGTWYHLAATFDNATDRVQLFVDGNLVHTGTLASSPTADTADLTIGRSPIGEYWRGKLDDVRIYDQELSTTQIGKLAADAGSNPPPAGCNGTYRDEFNAIAFTGSDGTIAWTDPWSEEGESDGANKGDVRVMKDQSNYQLRIQDNDNGGEGVERQADLSGAGSAILSFDYRRSGLDNGNDYVAVYASSSGVAGPWTEIVRIEGSGNDSGYQAYTQDISDHISSNTAIRLRSSPTMGNKDAVYFDNIQIQCSP